MRDRGRGREPVPGLAAHLRSTLWGPAEFVGLPGAGLLTHGLTVGILGVIVITGAGVVGMWAGPSMLRSGEAGLVTVAALVLYLTVLRAGRVLVGLVGVLGVCLALAVPQAAAGRALANRGQEQSAQVTSVESRGHDPRRFLCEVDPDGPGVSPPTKIWRGCTRSTDPGDVLTVLYDPTGRIPVRGMAQPGEQTAYEVQLIALALLLAGGTTLAVVRSFRFSLP
ncbi:hypothetical protein ACIRJR_01530 [Streptomyces sp. NPDC102402]|uniref:hypothetical protein n=1 Tax=Streptomyces sp. NPDC102402 TaxID=3366169 RepID=UPI00382BAB2A